MLKLNTFANYIYNTVRVYSFQIYIFILLNMLKLIIRPIFEKFSWNWEMPLQILLIKYWTLSYILKGNRKRVFCMLSLLICRLHYKKSDCISKFTFLICAFLSDIFKGILHLYFSYPFFFVGTLCLLWWYVLCTF